jgi:hypothetical protein
VKSDQGYFAPVELAWLPRGADFRQGHDDHIVADEQVRDGCGAHNWLNLLLVAWVAPRVQLTVMSLAGPLSDLPFPLRTKCAVTGSSRGA